MSNKTCKDCKHWHKVEELPGGMVMKDEDKPGDCLHSPPGVVCILGSNMGQPVSIIQSHYPRLKPGHRICGQFAQRLELGQV